MKNYGQPPPVLERCPTCGTSLTSKYAIKVHREMGCSAPKPPPTGVRLTRE